MNNPASNKESSKPSTSIKRSHQVEAQLARRKKAKSEAASETATVPSPEMGIVPASTLPSVEKVHLAETETAAPVEIVPELQLRKEQADRKMLGKVKRAFIKAGVEAGPEAQADFLNNLLSAKVPVLNRSSGRISRVLKGEKSIESLLLVRLPRKTGVEHPL
jgi:hypothetical protein